MTAASARVDEARSRLEQDVTRYAAAVLAAETGCRVTPSAKPGRFEVTHDGGALIGTMGEILVWN